MRITPLEAWTLAVIAAAAVLTWAAVVASLWYSRRGPVGPGRHVLGRPVFDGDPGGWGTEGPNALLREAAELLDDRPPIDWHTAPPPDMAETHADMFGVPTPIYTELDAWRAEEEAAERLAGTATRFMVVSIIRGLEYRDTIDLEAGLILERACAALTLIDIGVGLS
jgi:hypothetical protein